MWIRGGWKKERRRYIFFGVSFLFLSFIALQNMYIMLSLCILYNTISFPYMSIKHPHTHGSPFGCYCCCCCCYSWLSFTLRLYKYKYNLANKVSFNSTHIARAKKKQCILVFVYILFNWELGGQCVDPQNVQHLADIIFCCCRWLVVFFFSLCLNQTNGERKKSKHYAKHQTLLSLCIFECFIFVFGFKQTKFEIYCRHSFHSNTKYTKKIAKRYTPDNLIECHDPDENK